MQKKIINSSLIMAGAATKTFVCFIACLAIYSCSIEKGESVIDEDIANISSNVPVSFELNLEDNQCQKAKEGQLAFSGESINGERIKIPLQVVDTCDNSEVTVVTVIPEDIPDLNELQITSDKTSSSPLMRVFKDPDNGQIEVKENEQKVLQYNYKTVYEEDVIRLANAKPEDFTRSETDTFVTTAKYAVPRSNYIHPLYGLEGEMLTRDWPEGAHPHHRGIFWAWPEVEYGSERGDLYALQRVFARPTGNIQLIDGPVFAQIEAENLWKWEDTESIVREDAVIRVYKKGQDHRIVDLTLQFTALEDSITIATRNTDSYGGLNLRMETPDSQKISYFTDKSGSTPLRAWSDFSGNFIDADTTTGLSVFQHPNNPEYPGTWIHYDDLSWVQPTFPSPGTRFSLKKEEPLTLRYRLYLHKGGEPKSEYLKKNWDAYHNGPIPQ